MLEILEWLDLEALASISFKGSIREDPVIKARPQLLAGLGITQTVGLIFLACGLSQLQLIPGNWAPLGRRGKGTLKQEKEKKEEGSRRETERHTSGTHESETLSYSYRFAECYPREDR